MGKESQRAMQSAIRGKQGVSSVYGELKDRVHLGSGAEFPRSADGRRWMRHATFVRACVITLISVIISWFVTIGIMLMTSGDIAVIGLFIATIVPCVVAFPAVIHLEKNRMALAAAHKELAIAHEKLVAMHLETTEIAKKDFLTGLYNREYFFNNFEKRLRNRDNGALLMIDADRFKSVNDTYGHQAGDEALKLLAGAMDTAMREDDLLARLGGEEFAMFLPSTSLSDARIIAERVRKAVYAIRFEPISGVTHQLSISIGVVICGRETTVSKMFNNADSALYEAKQSGRNRVVVYRDKTVKRRRVALTDAA